MRQPEKEFNSILAKTQPQFAGMNRAVFLDRDGTMIAEKNYLSRPEDVEIFPAASAGLKKLCDAGFKLIIVSNQSGVGRGYFTLADVDRVNEHLCRELARVGVEVVGVSPLRLRCRVCHGEWSPVVESDGRITSRYWMCHTGCNGAHAPDYKA